MPKCELCIDPPKYKLCRFNFTSRAHPTMGLSSRGPDISVFSVDFLLSMFIISFGCVVNLKFSQMPHDTCIAPISLKSAYRHCCVILMQCYVFPHCDSYEGDSQLNIVITKYSTIWPDLAHDSATVPPDTLCNWVSNEIARNAWILDSEIGCEMFQFRGILWDAPRLSTHL